MEKRKKWEIMAEEVDRLAAKIDNLEKSAAKETSKEGTMINVTGLIAEIPKLSVRMARIERKLGEPTLNGIPYSQLNLHTPSPNKVQDRWVVNPNNVRLGEILTSPEYQKLMREKEIYKAELEVMEKRHADVSQSRDHFRRQWERERQRSGMICSVPIEPKIDWKENIFFGFFVGLMILGGWKLVELIATLIF